MLTQSQIRVDDSRQKVESEAEDDEGKMLANTDSSFFYKSKLRTAAAISHPAFFINEADMIKWLQRTGVDVSKFGVGPSKPASALLNELLRGESRLLNSDNGQALRVIHVATIVIFGPGRKTCLVETHRECSWEERGKVKKGNMPSIKMKTPMLPPAKRVRDGVCECVAACLLRELNMKPTIDVLHKGQHYTKWVDRVSNSMGSLMGRYYVHMLNIDINPTTVVIAEQEPPQPRRRMSNYVQGKEVRRRSIDMPQAEEKLFSHFRNATPFVIERNTNRGKIKYYYDWKSVGECLGVNEQDAFGLETRFFSPWRVQPEAINRFQLPEASGGFHKLSGRHKVGK
jgi:hypothetical protein